MRPFTIDEVMLLAKVYFEPRSNEEPKVLSGLMSKTLDEHKMWTGMYKYLNGIGFTNKDYASMTHEQAAIEEVLDEINTRARRYFINNFLRKKLQLQPDHEMMEIIMRLGYDPMQEVERMLSMNPPVTREQVQIEFDKHYDAILVEAQSYADSGKGKVKKVELVFT